MIRHTLLHAERRERWGYRATIAASIIVIALNVWGWWYICATPFSQLIMSKVYVIPSPYSFKTKQVPSRVFREGIPGERLRANRINTTRAGG